MEQQTRRTQNAEPGNRRTGATPVRGIMKITVEPNHQVVYSWDLAPVNKFYIPYFPGFHGTIQPAKPEVYYKINRDNCLRLKDNQVLYTWPFGFDHVIEFTGKIEIDCSSG